MNKQLEFIPKDQSWGGRTKFLNLLVIVAWNAQTVAEKLSIFAAHPFCAHR